MRVRLLLFFLLLVPILEIALFVVIGGAMGVWATLGWVLLAAFVGVQLIRLEGIGAMYRARDALFRGEPPSQALWQGGLRMAAGALLVVPGFFTDAVAGGLWLYSLRRRPRTREVTLSPFDTRRAEPGMRGPRTIEGEAHRDD